MAPKLQLNARLLNYDDFQALNRSRLYGFCETGLLNNFWLKLFCCSTVSDLTLCKINVDVAFDLGQSSWIDDKGSPITNFIWAQNSDVPTLYPHYNDRLEVLVGR